MPRRMSKLRKDHAVQPDDLTFALQVTIFLKFDPYEWFAPDGTPSSSVGSSNTAPGRALAKYAQAGAATACQAAEAFRSTAATCYTA